MSDDERDEDEIEAAARMAAFGGPLPRAYFELVDRLVEARGGWDGAVPIGGIADDVLDQIFDRANALRGELFGMAVEATAMPVTRH